jgi:hypothetical protein
MKKNILKSQRKELFKNRPISAREIELSNAHWESKVILGSEDLIWRSDVYDATDSVIKNLIDLTKTCIEFKILIDDSKQLHEELSLHNATHNIELKTDVWLKFCASLRYTEISEVAGEVENKLNVYVSKYLKIRS